jgi:hypothetical protein
LGEEEIRGYQIYLTSEKELAPRSIHMGVAALRFPYGVTLKKRWTFEDVLPLPVTPAASYREPYPRLGGRLPRRDHHGE